MNSCPPLTLVSHPGLPWNKVGYGLVDREPVIATYEPLSLVNPVGLNLIKATDMGEKGSAFGIARLIRSGSRL